MTAPEISVIIPAHNEELRIGRTLDCYYNFFLNAIPSAFEIIVVVNGCKDNTMSLVSEFCNRHKEIKPLHFAEAIGKGAAIKEGFKIANGRFISFTDADASTRPEEMLKLISECMEGYDGVIGSRWMKGSRVLIKQSLKRRLASRIFNLIVRVAFRIPYRDTQCGAKVFRDYVIKSIAPEIKTSCFVFDVDLLYKVKREGYNIREVPIVWEDKYGSSVILHRDAPTMLKALFKLWLQE